MKKAFWILPLLIVSYSYGCKERVDTSQQIPNTSTDTIVQKGITVKFRKLVPAAQKDLNDFPEFKPVKSGLDSLNYINPETASVFLSDLNERIADFEELLPKKLKTNPITARVKVLLTEVGMLEQRVGKGDSSTETLNTSKKAIAKAYDDFVNQVNEYYLEIPENIAKELLQKSRNLSDSIPLP